MNLGENIYNAFEVVSKTHESVDKFMQFCRRMAQERGEFELKSPRFLRYRSDRDYHGWNIGMMILLFQDTQDKLLENGWRDGPVYVLEIMLYDADYRFSEEPYLEIAKFEYEDMEKMPVRISPSDGYLFWGPLNEIDCETLDDGFYAADIADEDSRNYLGLKRFVSRTAPLVQVNHENAYEVVFGAFQELKNR